MRLKNQLGIIAIAACLAAGATIFNTSCSEVNGSNTMLGADGTGAVAQEIIETGDHELIEIAKHAAHGSHNSQELLGLAYLRGKFGLQPNAKKAVDWCTRAADQGNINAMADLGMIYSLGNGVGVTTDKAKAAEWFKKAADQGHVMAAYILANMYYEGNGVEKDPQKCYEYMLKAAQSGHNDAMYTIGTFYLEGYYVAQDTQMAHKWYAKAENP